MGADTSKGVGAPATLAASKSSRVIVADVVSPSFTVEVLRLIAGVPSILALRIDREALTVLDPGTGGTLRAWPYHRILCWGYTASTFQWKVFHTKAPRPAGATPPAASGAPPGVSSSSVTAAGGGGVIAALSSSAPHVGTTTGIAGGGGGAGGTAAAAAAPVGGGGGKDRSQSPDVIAAVAATTALPPDADAATVETFIVLTPSGSEIENEVMGAVRRLMSDMAARGVPDDEFATLLVTLRSLADEGAAEQAMATVRQMALTRAFDVRQAVQLVEAIGEVSPFDKLEAAVTLYGSVMNKESYPLVLACFDDAVERDNICHRLGIAVDASGRILATNAKGAAGVGGGSR